MRCSRHARAALGSTMHHCCKPRPPRAPLQARPCSAPRPVGCSTGQPRGRRTTRTHSHAPLHAPGQTTPATNAPPPPPPRTPCPATTPPHQPAQPAPRPGSTIAAVATCCSQAGCNLTRRRHRTCRSWWSSSRASRWGPARGCGCAYGCTCPCKTVVAVQEWHAWCGMAGAFGGGSRGTRTPCPALMLPPCASGIPALMRHLPRLALPRAPHSAHCPAPPTCSHKPPFHTSSPLPHAAPSTCPAPKGHQIPGGG